MTGCGAIMSATPIRTASATAVVELQNPCKVATSIPVRPDLEYNRYRTAPPVSAAAPRRP